MSNKTPKVQHTADGAQAGIIQLLYLWIPHAVQLLQGEKEQEFFEKLNIAPF